MSSKSKILRAFASSRETQNEEAKPALVPKLRFPEFRGKEEWKRVPLKEITTALLDGDWIESKDQSESGYRLIQTGNVGVGEFIAKSGKARYVSEETFARLRCTEIFPGDCLVSRLPDPAGRSCFIPDIGGKMITAVDCTIVRFDQSKIVPYLFIAHSQTDGYFREVAALSSGSTRQRISRENLSGLSLPLPPTPAEQQKIAECLSSVDEVIAAQGRKLDALKTHKKGLMQQLFPGTPTSSSASGEKADGDVGAPSETQPRLRFPEFQNAWEWEEVALGEIVEVASGQVDPKKPPYRDYPQIGSENIESNTGKLVNVKSAGEKGVISGNYLFDENDVLYSKIRPALNKAAAPDFTGICSADIYPIWPANDALLRSYLLYLLLSDKFLEHAIRSSDRGKIPKINREDLLGYVAAIPKPPEQHRIATCLSSLDALIAAETQKHAALQRHKRGLMQQLFPSPEEVEA